MNLDWKTAFGILVIPVSIAFATGISIGYSHEPFTILSIYFSSIAIGLAIAIFAIQQSQGDRIRELVKDVHVFADVQTKVRENKQRKYARIILSGLNMIDFELEGVKIQHKFLKAIKFGDFEKEKQHRDQLIGHYYRIQKIYTDYHLKDIDSDILLEVFNELIEEQYWNTWSKVSLSADIYLMSGDVKLDFFVEKMDEGRPEFVKLKNLVIECIPKKERSRYEKMFDPDRFSELDHKKKPKKND